MRDDEEYDPVWNEYPIEKGITLPWPFYAIDSEDDRKVKDTKSSCAYPCGLIAFLGMMSACAINPPQVKNPEYRISIDQLFAKACTIEYESEPMGQDYWKTWQETERDGRGDCEDSGFYLEHLLKSNGYECDVKFGQYIDGRPYHAWVEACVNGKEFIYDPANHSKTDRKEATDANMYIEKGNWILKYMEWRLRQDKADLNDKSKK